MTPATAQLLQQTPGIAAGFLAATDTPWLLTERGGRLLDGNPPFLKLMGWATLPADTALADFFTTLTPSPFDTAGVWTRIAGDLTTGLDGVRRLRCLSFRQGHHVLLLVERADILLPVNAVTAMSRINDEMVDITRELQKKKAQLEDALAQVRTLEAMLPICASCKQIRDDQDQWQPIETYIKAHTDTVFSHGICPACMKKLYPDYAD